MKEAIGGVSLFQIVVLFVLLFTGIMCLTINHSKAFAVKDEIITIIQNEGLTNAGTDYELGTNTIKKIADYLSEAGYRITGDCPSGYTTYNRDGSIASNGEGAFCIKSNNVVTDAFKKDALSKCTDCVVAEGDYPTMVYYDVVLFYQLEIPVINNLTNFKVYGSTKVLFN